MKFIYLFLLALGIVSCQTTKESGKFSSGDFEIIKAYQQKWFGGRPGVSGTYYKVELKQIKEGKIDFDSIFVQNQWQRAILEDKNPFVVMANITNPRPSETQEIFDLSNGEIIDNEANTTSEKEVTSKYDGKNILVYRINGAQKMMEIGEFTREESKMYP